MQMNPMCSISEVVGQHQRRAGNANITPEQQGRPQSPATQSQYGVGNSLKVLFVKDNGSFLLLGRKCTVQEI